jgi:hypothetical protein
MKRAQEQLAVVQFVFSVLLIQIFEDSVLPGHEAVSVARQAVPDVSNDRSTVIFEGRHCWMIHRHVADDSDPQQYGLENLKSRRICSIC